MRFEDFLTSSTKVMNEKGVPPRIVFFFYKVLFYCMNFAFLLYSKPLIFILKLSVCGILLTGIFMTQILFDFRSIEEGQRFMSFLSSPE